MSLTVTYRISTIEYGKGDDREIAIKEIMIEETTRAGNIAANPQSAAEASWAANLAPETIMDHIVSCEHKEYRQLINDSTRIHFDDSPDTSNIDSNSDSNSDCDAQDSEDPTTNSDIESDSVSEGISDSYAELPVAEGIDVNGGGRRGYIFEPLSLRRSRRSAHLLALGQLGFSLAGYTIT